MEIVFFDGVCGLCNHFIDFVLCHDQYKKIYFSPLQGKFIKNTKAFTYSNQETIIFLKDQIVFIKSRAIIEILASLGGFWICIKILLVIPSFIRDFFYSFIAKKRYSWFGKKDQCRIPKKNEKEQFLE